MHLKKHIPHYQLHLNCESIIHLPNKALSLLPYRRHPVWYDGSVNAADRDLKHARFAAATGCLASVKPNENLNLGPGAMLLKTFHEGMYKRCGPISRSCYVANYRPVLLIVIHNSFIIHGLSHPDRCEQSLTPSVGGPSDMSTAARCLSYSPQIRIKLAESIKGTAAACSTSSSHPLQEATAWAVVVSDSL